MSHPPGRLSDGVLLAALKRVPAAQPEPLPREQSLLEVMVEDLYDGTGHETDVPLGAGDGEAA